jgi:hypothetical protein
MEELISQLLSSVRGIWNYRWLAEVPGLPAGRANKHATELPTSEAGVLAGQMGQMGQVVPVTESETNTQRAVKEALRRFEHCPRISLVCNKTRAIPGDDDDGHDD